MCSSSTGAVGGHSTHSHLGRLDLRLPHDPPVGGLQMAEPKSFEHVPVLRDEVVSLFASVPDGTVVDATVGGGGHAEALLSAYEGLRLIGLDRDPVAIAAARERLAPFGDRVSLLHARFSLFALVVADAGVGIEGGAGGAGGAGGGGGLSGVLFDLGVSSPQVDVAGRGFSYRADGPIDMRMDQVAEAGLTAGELVNTLPETELAALFRENGEGRLSGRIARAVVRARPLTSTRQLAEVVASAVPAAARRRGNPASRVFQALRIEVNDEMGELRSALPVALSSLAVGGVCAVISYHSGEDRLVKAEFSDAASGGCVCPPGMPCVCGAVPRHRLVFRGARKASAEEVAANPRAESARLRAIVRTDLG
jgi:16S rRNA (cytosine1402-N4)-methyltransferase